MILSRRKGIAFSCVVGVWLLCTANAQEVEGIQEQSVGYYPTYQESGILAAGDYDYERSSGGGLFGPDLDRWSATGAIWPFEYQDGGLSRLQRFMQPVDYVLRPLTPGETLTVQGPLSESWFQIGAGFPFLSRSYHPEKSTMADMFGMESTHYSPFFFDILSLSAIGVYVEGNGDGFREAGLEDGFLSAISVDVRAGWGITDRTSLILAGKLYLIMSPDLDFQFYADAGALSALASMNLQFEAGDWDFRLFDDLTPFSTRHLLYDESFTGDGMQQAGHYYVGIPNFVESGDWWDSRQHALINTLGFTAGTFLGDSLRFLAGVGRIDTWQWQDFDQHSPSEYLSAGLFYDGYELWVAPSLLYTLMTHDFEDAAQSLMLNLSAPISPNLTAYGGFGYFWSDDYDGYVWNIALQNRLSDRLVHSISYSSGYHDAVVGDDFIGNRLAYQINYQIGPRIALSAFAGWYEGEGERSDVFSAGATANYALGNYTFLQVGGAYYKTNDDHSIVGATDESWMYNVTINRRLAERLNGELGYEYIDSGIGRYQESVLLLRLTRTF